MKTKKAKVTLPLYDDKETLNEFVNLIRWASHKFSRRVQLGRYDYWDFFEEGLIILALCLCKWREKDPGFGNKASFQKYFKTALFNRFSQIQTKSHSKKRYGIHVPIQFATKVACDGGFNEVYYKELSDHVKTFLTETEEKIFSLLIDPPDDLVRDALHETARKQKQALITGSYDCRTVKISVKCLFRYMSRKEKHFPESSFLKSLRRVRNVVSEVLSKREEKLEVKEKKKFK